FAREDFRDLADAGEAPRLQCVTEERPRCTRRRGRSVEAGLDLWHRLPPASRWCIELCSRVVSMLPGHETAMRLRTEPTAGTLSHLGLRETKKRRLREAVERAALDLFARQGYEQTTVHDICAVAEVGHATFYRYFPTKEDVVFGHRDAYLDAL